MKYLSFILIVAFTIGVSAAPPTSLDQAKRLSAQTHKPILMEFVHQD